MKAFGGYMGERASETRDPSPRKRALTAFSQDTSLHGVKFALDGTISRTRRLAWVAVVIIQLAALVAVIVRQLIHINNRPLLTNVVNRYVRSLPFPAVTLCPHHITPNTSLPDFDRDVISNFKSKNLSYFKSLSREEYGSINIVHILKEQYRFQKDLVRRCRFGDLFDCKGSIRTEWTSRSRCFTINSQLPSQETSSSNTSGLTLEAVSPGVSGGMKLTLDLDSVPPDKLAFPGVKVMLHDPGEKVVSTNAQFLQLAPGTNNFISVRMKTSKFLPAPYKAFVDMECVETGVNFRHPLVGTEKYTVRACEDRCFQNKLEKLCGCKVSMESEDACDPISFLECLDLANDLMNNSTEVDVGKSCDCPIPCDEVIYEPTLSSTQIKGVPYSERDNMILVRIYFDRLRIESMKQVPDYTVGDVFASVGGQMGLFLGASIITVVEVLELLVTWTWDCLSNALNRSKHRHTR